MIFFVIFCDFFCDFLYCKPCFIDLNKFVQAFESVAGTVKAKADFNAQADCELFKTKLNKKGYPELCDLQTHSQSLHTKLR